jgi:hypothetical protein
MKKDREKQKLVSPLTETTTIILSLPTLFIAVQVYIPASVTLDSGIRRVLLERTLEEPVRGVQETMAAGRDLTCVEVIIVKHWCSIVCAKNSISHLYH